MPTTTALRGALRRRCTRKAPSWVDEYGAWYGGEVALKKTGDFAYSYGGTVEFESGEKQPIEGKATLYGGYAWRASGTLAGK